METLNYTLTLLTPMLGSIPKDKDAFTKYILAKKLAAKQKAAPPEDQQPLATELEEIEDLSFPSETGFYSDSEGIFLYDYQLRGFLRESGNNQKANLKIPMLREKITNFVFIRPRKIRLFSPAGSQIIEPTGTHARPLRAMTMQGPRITIVQSDTIEEGTTISFQVLILQNPHKIDASIIDTLFDFGEFQGLLQWRTGGWGRFSYKRN